MALQSAQSLTTTAAAPVPLTPSASETISATSFGPNGCYIRVITTGTTTTVTTLDPGLTPSTNPGAPVGQVMPATGTRQWLIPNSAIGSSLVATVTFSSITGVTYELTRV
jgi:hypothetical protein